MTAFIQLGINAYTALKSDYEQQLLRITNQISSLTCKSAALSEEMMNEIRSVYDYEAILTSENSEGRDQRIEAFNSGEFYAAYESQLALINSKEKSRALNLDNISQSTLSANYLIKFSLKF